MSTRILSAYFNDFRQGTKDFDALREYLMTCYRQDPMRRSHILNWMDQAQYEHPIPVTDFLMLRREMETMLKSGVELEEPDDATVMVSTGSFTPVPRAHDNQVDDDATRIADDATRIANEPTPADDDATRVAAGSTAPSATAVTEAMESPTLVAGSSTDATPLPERSDHMGFHDAATSLRPGSTATLVDSTPPPEPLPEPKPLQSRCPVLILGSAVVAAILVATVAGRYWLKSGTPANNVQPSSSVTSTPAPTTTPSTSSIPDTGSTENVGSTLENSTSLESSSGPESNPTPTTTETNPAPANATPPQPQTDNSKLATLNANGLLDAIRKRAQAGHLLPKSAPDSAYVPLNAMIKRFPDSPLLIKARVLLKDAHLKLSAQARKKGDWDEAQRQLDAAYDVLQPTATESTGPAQPGS